MGTLLVSKLHQVAMSRQETTEAERKNFYLYVDEFHNFITPSMASMLSGARKYHLGLILAHQELRQLWNRDSDVASAVISNPYTRICFRLGDFDAQKLADGFAYFEAKDLLNLGVGEAVARIERAEFDFNLKTLPLPPVEVTVAKTRRERLLELSRQTYASRRQDVEAEMEKQRGAFSSISDTPVAKPKPVASRFKPPPVIPLAIPVSNGATELKPVEETGETALLGRGGQQHKYLQQLVKKLAEARGFRAIVEKPVLNGSGSVDVSLEKGDLKIACEICITTTAEHEMGNLQKCLAAGYELVLALSSEAKTATSLKRSAESSLDECQLKKIVFLQPEEFSSFMDQMEAQSLTEEKTVRGYKVRVNYQAISEEEKKTKRQTIGKVIFGALKRLKGGS